MPKRKVLRLIYYFCATLYFSVLGLGAAAGIIGFVAIAAQKPYEQGSDSVPVVLMLIGMVSCVGYVVGCLITDAVDKRQLF